MQRLQAYTYKVWAVSLSLAATWEICSISFPLVTEMFHFTRSAHPNLWIQLGVMGVYPIRFPDSDISASKPIAGSTELFAGYHVLHRHLTPRHPSYTLSSLIIWSNYTVKNLICTRFSLIVVNLSFFKERLCSVEQQDQFDPRSRRQRQQSFVNFSNLERFTKPLIFSRSA